MHPGAVSEQEGRQHRAAVTGPTLSVVVPNYNHARYLPQCLSAILAQDRPADEILVIDDASTDGSLAVIEGFRARHPALRLLRHEANRGVIAALNRGLAEARGDYVLFAAADDWVLPGLFARALDLLGRHPGAGLCSALSLLARGDGDPPQPFPTPVVLDAPGYIPPARVRALLRRDGPWVIGTGAVLDRRAALALGGFRPELGSFCDGFLYELLALRHGACFLPEPLAVWRRLDAGYASATLADPGRMLAILDAATALMTGRYRALFSAAQVRRWRGRWRFATAQGLLRAPAPGRREALLAVLPGRGRLDRLVLRLAGGRRLPMLYLFLRLRPFDVWTVLRRRLSWRLGASDPPRRA